MRGVGGVFSCFIVSVQPALRGGSAEPGGYGVASAVRVARHDQEAGAEDDRLHAGSLAGVCVRIHTRA